MVRIETIRESNQHAKSLSGLVGIFVGGTGGIGESTLKELFNNTTAPRVYILGRDERKANQLVEELKANNEGSDAFFMRCDVSLLKNVDQACEEIQRREKSINILFLTAGYMSLQGRNETPEGIDRKMCVNYYSRMRFIVNLMPQLTAAARANQLSRVLSVLAAGSEGDIRMDDLELKHNFTLHACLAHCVMMTDFFMEELGKRFPNTSFSHSYPGTVKTGIANELTGPVRLAVKVLYAVMTPWILNVRESGERHLFQITNKMYPARNGGVGIPVPEGLEVTQGSDGEQGSGSYLLDWDGKAAGDESLLKKYRDQNFGQTVWDHTHAVFKRAVGGKRPAEGEAEASRRPAPPVPNPTGWRSY